MDDNIYIEYELNEGIYVIHNTLESLYEKYQYILPADIKEKLKELLTTTEDLIGDNGSIADIYDIVRDNLVLKVRYKKFVTEPTEVKKESK